MKKKKILYIGNNLKNSNPTTMVQLSLMLKKEGFLVDLYSDKKNPFSRLFYMCFGVLKHYKSDCLLIDTYSTYNFYYALIISQLARLLSIKYIPILHGGNLPDRLSKSPFLSKLIFNNSYLNCSPSTYLVEKFKNEGFKTMFIPNSLNLKIYQFKKRSKFEPKLLWVRAFEDIYNPKMALQVLYNLKNKGINATLCMVGPDKDGSLNEIKELAKKLNITEQLELTGYLPKEVWLKKAAMFNIFLNTTTIDNIPVSVLEAMALGLPIVSTNVGGIPYLIDDKKTGYLVENNNIEAMTNAIITIINNPLEVEKVIYNTKELLHKFDEKIVLNNWLEILK